ncbi:hypothetical protein F2P44_29105 [Massilia sp. CCM 8695]|uniref:Transposase IS66 zinc-finger binding domain-containing protein n=1 Tax=Massilia frigida TaxID=2609281 RepID=A0ABX0NIK7_9BURK|nr:hypothetical protein [Massilia frigida]NHZ83302.1 hypothetical protein [Massilia frigida]
MSSRNGSVFTISYPDLRVVFKVGDGVAALPESASSDTDGAAPPTGSEAEGTAHDGKAAPVTNHGKSRSPSRKSHTRKAGKQPGAQGFGRTQQLAIDATVPHFADQCAVCGHALLHEGAQAYTGWDEIDIATKIDGVAGLRLRVSRHLLHASTCDCGHVTHAPHHAAPDDPF